MSRYQIRYSWMIAAYLATAMFTCAQTDIKEGGHVVIASGGTLTTKVNVTIGAGGNLVNDGMICIGRDLINENQGADNLGSGIFNFSGEVNQTIAGENILGSLIMDNPAGLNLAGHTQVLGLLTLSSGRIVLGLYHLTLGVQAMIAGNPSAASMVVATSTGEFRKMYDRAGSFTFPVGDADQVAEYSPVTLAFSGGSGAFPPGSYAGVTVANMQYPDPNISGNYLRRYWNLSHYGMSGFSCSVSFHYLEADVEGDEASLACTRVNPLPWTTFEPANITDHILTATGITFFSPPGGGGFSSFTGLNSTTVPATLQLSNIVIGPGNANCYAATQVLTVAGSGSSFMVLNGGSLDLTAGQVISFQPVAMVTAGGNLHAWISPGGPFCGTMPNRLVASNGAADGPSAVLVKEGKDILRIYPNPATDRITLEFAGNSVLSVVDLVIYNISGISILKRSFAGQSRIQLSLAGWPEGIFMVYARSENRTWQAKIIKQQP